MSATPTGSVPLYRDAGQPTADRVADLLARMTTVEKAAQLGSAWVFQLAAGTALTADAPALMEHGLGQVTRVSGASNVTSADAAAAANEIQRFLVEETRLGIPTIIHEEVCAGLMARGATVFPQPIGLASTWDPPLIERMASVVRAEMRAIGAHQGLSPVLDVCRDPRWGRIEETFGEDPHLVAMMGNAFVRGLQGEAFGDGVVATAKHLVGYGASQGGLNWAPAHIPARELLEVYLHPFEAAVRTAGLRSVMNAYNELDGVPCGASHELLTGILRDEWGFDGYVVADYFSVRQLEDYHHLVADATEAASVALAAGLDVELPMTDCYGPPLVDAVDGGIVAVEILDRAVERGTADEVRARLVRMRLRRRRRGRGGGRRRAGSSVRPLARQPEHRVVAQRRDAADQPDHDRDDRCHWAQCRRSTQPVRRLQLRRARRVAARDAGLRQRVPRPDPRRLRPRRRHRR